MKNWVLFIGTMIIVFGLGWLISDIASRKEEAVLRLKSARTGSSLATLSGGLTTPVSMSHITRLLTLLTVDLITQAAIAMP